MSQVGTSAFGSIDVGGRTRTGSFGLEIELNKRQQRRLEALLDGVRRGLPRARSSAIRRTATAAKGGAAKAIRNEITVPLGPIRKQITRELVGSGSNVTGAVVRIGGRRFNLARFQARQGKTALSYRIERGGPRQKIKTAWIADPRRGGRPLGPGSSGGPAKRPNVVFARQRNVARTPFYAARGPSPAQVASKSPGVSRFAAQEVPARLEKELLRQVDRITRRAG